MNDQPEKDVMRIKQAILGVAVSICGVPCFADGYVNVFEVPLGVSVNVISNQLYHENINRTLHQWDNQPEKDRYKPSPKVPLAQTTGLGIAEMAKALPKDQAEAGRATYKQAFDYHEQVIRKFGLPSGDLGVAVASAIAGAWMAYNNKPFPDQFYVPLVNQMRQRLSSRSADLQALPAAERTTTYESLAVTGMLLASSQITWQRNPRAAGADALLARMRTQGGETLTRMLQVAPEKVAIGPAGVYSQN
ncbi:MAG TPA: DUF6683 family protein [Roseateles sp.]